MAALAPGDGAAAQDAGPFAPLWTGARELLRTLSYYAMKKRAGVVGEQGLGPLLSAVQGRRGDVRAHLIGHSFGARLISYALRPLPRAWIPGGSLDTIVADVPELERGVERLAVQKPRSGGWLSHLREGGGDLDSQR